MNKIICHKYHGTGNDFVMIDNRENRFRHDPTIVRKLCDRRFGVGADGLILLELCQKTDFLMVYFNADGNQSTMCGNGARCLVKFAHDLDVISEKATFQAIDGIHTAIILQEKVCIKMKDINHIEHHRGYYLLNTGSPHYVTFVDGLVNYDVFHHGRKIRHKAPYEEEGVNVNFVEKTANNTLFVRTYERGVEDETYSCGTGAVASAVAAYEKGWVDNHVFIKTLGGNLEVQFEKEKNKFIRIRLSGPAKFVFKTEINIDDFVKR